MIEREFTVIAIHGEGDQATVNTLQKHRNTEELIRLQRSGAENIPPHLSESPDEPPDIIIVMRDIHGGNRMEIPVNTWDEVREWKKLAGWNQATRQWPAGAIIKVQMGG